MNKQKTVIFVSPTTSSFTRPITSAFRQIGFRVVLFHDDRPNILTRIMGFISNNLFRGNNFFQKKVTDGVNNALKKTIYSMRPDYLLIIKGMTIESETVTFARQLGVVTINWFPDCQHVWPWVSKNALAYDFFLTCCLDLLPRLKALGVKSGYFPYAADPDVEIKYIPKRYNVVFIGQYTKRRERYFRLLTPLGFHIWGHHGWRRSKLSAYYHGYLDVDQMKKVYRQSKIVVNLTTSEEEDGFTAVNLRNFEVTGVGTLLLTQYNKAIKQIFKDKKDVIYFAEENDLVKKVKHYLADNKEREKIANQGWMRIKKSHTYTKRLKQLFTYVEKNKNKS